MGIIDWGVWWRGRGRRGAFGFKLVTGLYPIQTEAESSAEKCCSSLSEQSFSSNYLLNFNISSLGGSSVHSACRVPVEAAAEEDSRVGVELPSVLRVKTVS